MIGKNTFMVLVLAFLLMGCVHLTDQYGEVISIVQSESTLSGVGVASEEILQALVKGSIYESGEQMSVFGACLDGGDQPFNESYATFSAWYPNGTSFFSNVSLPEIQQGYFLYTAPMSNVQGTYLTELTCHVNGSDQVAKAFGEWQNPFWVERISLLNESINNLNFTNVSVDLQPVLDALDAMNITLENVDNNTLTLISNMQELNLTTNDILTIVQDLNLTLGDISTAIDGNFTLINFKLDELNLTLEQQDVVLDAINTTIINQYGNLTDLINNLNISIGDGFDALNQTLISEFSVLNATMVSNFNNLESLIVSSNATNVAQYNNLTAFLSAMNVSMINEFSLLNNTIVNNHNEVVGAIEGLNVSLLAQFSNLSAYLVAMNASMMSEFADLSSFLFDMNVSMHLRFDLIDGSLSQMNSTLINTNNVVNALNLTTVQGFEDLTTLINALEVTIDGRFNITDANFVTVDQNLTAIYNAINNLDFNGTNVSVDLQPVLDAISAMNSSFYAQLDSHNDNLLAINQSLQVAIDAIEVNVTAGNVTVNINLTEVLDEIGFTQDLIGQCAEHVDILGIVNSSYTGNYGSPQLTISEGADGEIGVFSADGAYLYVDSSYGSSGQHHLLQYALSPVWNLANASLYQVGNLSLEADKYQNYYRDVDFSADGLFMYFVEMANATVTTWSLSEAWNISTASISSDVYTLQDSCPGALWFSTDGSEMIELGVCNGTSSRVYSHELSTSWNVSSASYSGDYVDIAGDWVSYPMLLQGGLPDGFDTLWNSSTLQSIELSPNGLQMYLLGDINGSFDGDLDPNVILQYDLSVAYDVSSAVYAGTFTVYDASLGIWNGDTGQKWSGMTYFDFSWVADDEAYVYTGLEPNTPYSSRVFEFQLGVSPAFANVSIAECLIDGFHEVWSSVDVVNNNVLAINDTVNYYGGVMNSSHTEILSLLNLLLNVTQGNINATVPNSSLSWIEYPDDRVIYYDEWHIDVEVFNNLGTQIGWPVVSCFINTTNIPNSVNEPMVSKHDNNQQQNPYFKHEEKVKVLTGFNWSTWCVYN